MLSDTNTLGHSQMRHLIQRTTPNAKLCTLRIQPTCTQGSIENCFETKHTGLG